MNDPQPAPTPIAPSELKRLCDTVQAEIARHALSYRLAPVRQSTQAAAMMILTAAREIGGAPADAPDLLAEAHNLLQRTLDLQRPDGAWDGEFPGFPGTGVTASVAFSLAHIRWHLASAKVPETWSDLEGRLDLSNAMAMQWLEHRAPRDIHPQTAALVLAARAMAMEAARQANETPPMADLLTHLLTRQHEEGWFDTGTGTADLLAQACILDDLCLHAHLTGTWHHLGQLERAFEFLDCYMLPGGVLPSPHHPHGAPPAVGRLATLLLADKLPAALCRHDALEQLALHTPPGAALPGARGLEHPRMLALRGERLLLAASWGSQAAASIAANRELIAAPPGRGEHAGEIRVALHPVAGVACVWHGHKRSIIAGRYGCVQSFPDTLQSVSEGTDASATITSDLGLTLRYRGVSLRAARPLTASTDDTPTASFEEHRAPGRVTFPMGLAVVPRRLVLSARWARAIYRLLRLAPATRRPARNLLRWARAKSRSADARLARLLPPAPLLHIQRWVTLDDEGQVTVEDTVRNAAGRPIALRGHLTILTQPAPPEPPAPPPAVLPPGDSATLTRVLSSKPA